MGAWGYRSFENDFADDWLGDFLEQPGKPALSRTLHEVLEIPASERELPEESAAIGAAEIVAALAGYPDDNLDLELADWLERTRSAADQKLIKLAMRAVEAVRAEGELTASFDAVGRRRWLAATENLLVRLKRALKKVSSAKPSTRRLQ